MENKEEMKVIGTYSISNCFYIAVLNIEYSINDYVIYQYRQVGEDPTCKIRKTKLYYTANGDAYFRTPSGRIHMKEVLAVYN